MKPPLTRSPSPLSPQLGSAHLTHSVEVEQSESFRYPPFTRVTFPQPPPLSSPPHSAPPSLRDKASYVPPSWQVMCSLPTFCLLVLG
ncbi:hypothetical protein E2C01_003369 [Portunus trituberculatus]|uniref:Uncharacterized protein n=1 Tax=Portunus trituberculatus TaxID=210409 RepID=A0A5B7CMN1_PORTR|nr:hypothetical protein [Portunus trituberculatus]